MAAAVPGGVPPAAAEIARGTVGGAVAVAAHLPDALAAELLGTARAAYAGAFAVVAYLGAAISVGVAVLALVLLRRVRPAAHPARA